MSDREVKTRQTFGEFADRFCLSGERRDDAEVVWNAALASVILPEGRFEVGMKALGRIGVGGPFVEGVFGLSCGDWLVTKPENVRPLPKTVDLTVNEKLRELATAMLNKIEPTTSDAVAYNLIGIHIEISQSLANGKTLDQLCSEFGVSTTKEMS